MQHSPRSARTLQSLRPQGATLAPSSRSPSTGRPLRTQDVIVGGAVTAAVAAALVSGLRKEPEPCPLCQGTGGAKCFGCGGAGEMGALIDPLQASAARPARRDVVGRSGGNPRACRVCSGAGLVLCRECRGSGFVTKV